LSVEQDVKPMRIATAMQGSPQPKKDHLNWNSLKPVSLGMHKSTKSSVSMSQPNLGVTASSVVLNSNKMGGDQNRHGTYNLINGEPLTW